MSSATKPAAPIPGRRSTKQRTAIAAQLERTTDFRTAQQLHDDLKSGGLSIGLTTVYRTLQALADAGDVDVRRTDDGEALYRMCAEPGTHHHHFHLVCRRCGKAVEIDDAAMDAWAHALATTHGYSDVSHTIELFGVCADCAQSRN